MSVRPVVRRACRQGAAIAMMAAALVAAPAGATSRSDAQAAAAWAEGQRLQRGEGVAPDPQRALARFEDASRLGSADAAYALSRHYRGLTGLANDPQRAREQLQRAAERQHLQAQVELAFLHLNGMPPVPRDLDAAYRWFSVAARRGSVAAACQLGDFHQQGWGGATRSATLAVGWWRRTADRADACAAHSQFALYRAYLTGGGVPRHGARAMAWLEKAAESGDVRAQRALGRAYERGEGVPRDAGLARHWLRKSREGVAPHDDHEHDLPSFAGPLLFQKLAPFQPNRPPEGGNRP
ncbi:tetratricopeptide repeat protein [Pseudacidovorax intermedius]|uniref:tetratricopeptide repeat protein n=1 Tax=Pseudacidovorax intermedius TaxID=433924 RepID=UPI0026F2D0AD|nr:tetratricopeptide repeat protein [Pseudacidovorax intermedius]